tara:strand:+ start:16889 stop:17782 length:894 start_codon:yes stop_codon:yes gene_type:complete
MLINLIKKTKDKFYLNFLENLYLNFFSSQKNKDHNRSIAKILQKYENKKLSHWEGINYLVLKKIYKYGFENFLRIRQIRNTMFVNDEENFKKYLKLINLESDYEIIKENLFGNPSLSKNAKFTSINKLHQFYHLKFFNKLTKSKHPDNYIEIGGGYGLLCLLTLKYMNVKKYIIYDLEGFNEIQKIYLRELLPPKDFKKIEFINDFKIFKKKISKIKRFNFFAFWSISEINEEFRNRFLFIIKKTKFFLIGYQDYFRTIDNKKYFKNFIKELKEFNIQKKKHPCYQNEYYLFGKLKN